MSTSWGVALLLFTPLLAATLAVAAYDYRRQGRKGKDK